MVKYQPANVGDPHRINPRRNMPRHIVIKLTKTKRKKLKAARKKKNK